MKIELKKVTELNGGIHFYIMKDEIHCHSSHTLLEDAEKEFESVVKNCSKAKEEVLKSIEI